MSWRPGMAESDPAIKALRGWLKVVVPFLGNVKFRIVYLAGMAIQW
jgi:hypothetical protein